MTVLSTAGIRAGAPDMGAIEPKKIGPDATLSEACALMRELRVDALAVFDGGQQIGVLTERDVIRHWDRAAAGGFALPVSVLLADAAAEGRASVIAAE